MNKLIILLLLLISTQMGRLSTWQIHHEALATNIYIGNFGKVHNIISDDDIVFIHSDLGLIQYSIEKRALQEITYGQNFLVSSDERIVICEWRNFRVSEPSENATKITVKDVKGVILHEYSLPQTVRPLSCMLNIEYFIDNYPGSPERIYKMDPKGQLIEITENIPEDLYIGEVASLDLYQTDQYRIIIERDNDIWLYRK